MTRHLYEENSNNYRELAIQGLNTRKKTTASSPVNDTTAHEEIDERQERDRRFLHF